MKRTEFRRGSAGHRKPIERNLKDLSEEGYLLLPSSRITKTIIHED
jgi:hypothetical protein